MPTVLTPWFLQPTFQLRHTTSCRHSLLATAADGSGSLSRVRLAFLFRSGKPAFARPPGACGALTSPVLGHFSNQAQSPPDSSSPAVAPPGGFTMSLLSFLRVVEEIRQPRPKPCAATSPETGGGGTRGTGGPDIAGLIDSANPDCDRIYHRTRDYVPAARSCLTTRNSAPARRRVRKWNRRAGTHGPITR